MMLLCCILFMFLVDGSVFIDGIGLSHTVYVILIAS